MGSDLDKVLRRKFWRCYSGWFSWKRAMLKSKTSIHGDKKTVVVLLSSDNRDYNYYGLLYLPSFMSENGYERAVVMGFDPTAVKAAQLFSPKITHALLLPQDDIMKIVDLYSLYKFRKHLVIVDLEKPNGRNGRALIGKRGITVEDMISVGIYNMFPVRRPSGPMYGGKDEEIVAFLRG